MNTSPLLIEWQDSTLSVGIPRMDETHKEFIDMVNHLGCASDTDFPTLFDELIEHTHIHFQNEDIAMENSEFAPIFIHRNEHFRILDELKKLAHHVSKGEFDAAKSFVCQYLPEWFPMHAATMDRALAHHLKTTGMAPD